MVFGYKNKPRFYFFQGILDIDKRYNMKKSNIIRPPEPLYNVYRYNTLQLVK